LLGALVALLAPYWWRPGSARRTTLVRASIFFTGCSVLNVSAWRPTGVPRQWAGAGEPRDAARAVADRRPGLRPDRALVGRHRSGPAGARADRPGPRRLRRRGGPGRRDAGRGHPGVRP